MDFNNLVKWMDSNMFTGYRLLINLITVFVLIKYIYLRREKRTELFFTLFSFNIIIFFLSCILKNANLSAGAGFGLFAIFSLLRYRTEGMTAIDMTYLFLCIAIGLITAVSPGSYLEIPLICIIMLLLTYSFGSSLFYQREYSKIIYYDNIKQINKANEKELIKEVNERTGLNISRLEIHEIDFLKDACKLTIYFHD